MIDDPKSVIYDVLDGVRLDYNGTDYMIAYKAEKDEERIPQRFLCKVVLELGIREDGHDELMDSRKGQQ